VDVVDAVHELQEVVTRKPHGQCASALLLVLRRKTRMMQIRTRQDKASQRLSRSTAVAMKQDELALQCQVANG